jgi:hypothetical protein
VDQYKGILEQEEEGDLTNMDEYAHLNDPCSNAQFQMNMILPHSKEIMEEPEIEMEII